MAEALNEAMHAEMARDERVFVMGEDVALIGGIFGVTRGLRDKFGAERVRDTPISEATFLGAGVGAAIAGLRPIVEIQIFDFITVTMDKIVNQAAKFRYMLGGGPTVPLVIRGPQGGGIRLAAQHSPEPRGVVRPRAGPRGRGAVHAVRRQGPARRRHPRRQPRHLPRAQGALRREGPGAGRGVRDPARQGRRQARGRRRHRGRDAGDGRRGRSRPRRSSRRTASTSR